MPETPRRERRRLEIQSRIIEAAHHLFQSQGYRGTTVTQICEQADVAYKTFFNHFPSKHDVLVEIEQRSLENILSHFDLAIATVASTRDRLALLFERIAREAEDAGPMNRELLTELIHSVHSRGDEPEQVQRVIQATERLVEAGRAQGDVRLDQSVATLAELIRGSFYVLMISFGNLADYPIVERAAALASILADSIEDAERR
ncbi:MAG: TetR/AcrR family transcriptional regulator [Myxococcota bacterium]